MTEQKILGLSGKKQSGKNTAANYIAGLELITHFKNIEGVVSLW